MDKFYVNYILHSKGEKKELVLSTVTWWQYTYIARTILVWSQFKKIFQNRKTNHIERTSSQVSNFYNSENEAHIDEMIDFQSKRVTESIWNLKSLSTLFI